MSDATFNQASAADTPITCNDQNIWLKHQMILFQMPSLRKSFSSHLQTLFFENLEK